MSVSTSLCLQCQKEVKGQDSGLGCDMCGDWYHIQCVGIKNEVYKILQKGIKMDLGGVHWYCKQCIGAVAKLLKNVGGLQKRQDLLEEELETVKLKLTEMTKAVAEVKEVRKDVETLKKAEIKLSRKIDESMEKNAEDMAAWKKGTDANMKVILSEAVEVEVSKHTQTLVEVKTDLKKTDEKIEGTIRQRVDDNMLEDRERNARKSNVICFGIEESNEEEVDMRINQDRKCMEDILTSLHCDEIDIKQVIRLGKRPSAEDIQNGRKPRPLKVVFADEKSKNGVLEQARNLRKTQYVGVFMVQDMTPSERQQRKSLVKERDRRKENGEDVVIVQGKILLRKMRGES
jgi:hypothetical protein